MGIRPLLLDVKIKLINYIKNILERPNATAYSALEFEMSNEVAPNFFRYANMPDVIPIDNIFTQSKQKTKAFLRDDYDRYWRNKMIESPKALAYNKFKYNVSTEKYLYAVKNIRHKIVLTRLRLSNHKLCIETGIHLRPKLERHKRKCFICKDEIEDEIHFVVKCPLYSSERKTLFHTLTRNSKNFDLLNSDEQKFIFIMTNEDMGVMKQLAKFTFNSMQIRDNVIKIDNVSQCFEACVQIDPLDTSLKE